MAKLDSTKLDFVDNVQDAPGEALTPIIAQTTANRQNAHYQQGTAADVNTAGNEETPVKVSAALAAYAYRNCQKYDGPDEFMLPNMPRLPSNAETAGL